MKRKKQSLKRKSQAFDETGSSDLENTSTSDDSSQPDQYDSDQSVRQAKKYRVSSSSPVNTSWNSCDEQFCEAPNNDNDNMLDILCQAAKEFYTMDFTNPQPSHNFSSPPSSSLLPTPSPAPTSTPAPSSDSSPAPTPSMPVAPLLSCSPQMSALLKLRTLSSCYSNQPRMSSVMESLIDSDARTTDNGTATTNSKETSIDDTVAKFSQLSNEASPSNANFPVNFPILPPSGTVKISTLINPVH